MQNRTIYLTRAGMIAALYVALTVTPPINVISYGNIQCRISEALSVLAFFEPAAIPGLFLGCVIANAIGMAIGSSLGPLDVVLGSALTLLSAIIIWRTKKPLMGLMAPVLLNAFGVAFILNVYLQLPYWLSVVQVGIGEAIAVFALGYPLLLIFLKRNLLIREEVFKSKMGQ
jgi:uncharacterized membrane protein